MRLSERLSPKHLSLSVSGRSMRACRDLLPPCGTNWNRLERYVMEEVFLMHLCESHLPIYFFLFFHQIDSR